MRLFLLTLALLPQALPTAAQPRPADAALPAKRFQATGEVLVRAQPQRKGRMPRA